MCVVGVGVYGCRMDDVGVVGRGRVVELKRTTPIGAF